METRNGSRLVPPDPRRISPTNMDLYKMLEGKKVGNLVPSPGVASWRGAVPEGVGRSWLFLVGASADCTAVCERLEGKKHEGGDEGMEGIGNTAHFNGHSPLPTSS